MELELNKTKPLNRKRDKFFAFLDKTLRIEKLNNPTGFAVLLVSCLFFALAIKKAGLVVGVLLILASIGIPAVYAIVAYPKVGIIILLVAAYLLMWIMRMGFTTFPLGTLMDGFQALLLIGFFIKQKQNPNWKIYHNPITALIIIWIVYNIIQLANPSAESRMAWLYTIRTVAVVMLMYFVFMYNITSIDYIKIVLKLWLGLSLFAALYAWKQENIGYFDFESRGLADEKVRSLLFIDGHWRKYGIFSDPVAYAYNMVASTLLCFGLIMGPTTKRQKIILSIMAVFFIMVMMYSGTRGAYVLLPAAFALYAVMHFNKKILVVSIAGAMMMLFLISIPTSNATLVRFQSAFKPSKDLSYQVRKNNQKRIQPFILTHPLGGGLGATGVWGQRFAPWSFLANFPPDSGYVRTAVELGSIGLLIFCTFMFIVLKKGIEHYYEIKDPWLKCVSLTMLLIAFALNVANFPQEAFVQFPINIYFYLVVALINIVYRLDKELESKKLNEGRID